MKNDACFWLKILGKNSLIKFSIHFTVGVYKFTGFFFMRTTQKFITRDKNVITSKFLSLQYIFFFFSILSFLSLFIQPIFWDNFEAISSMKSVLCTSLFYCWDFPSIYCIRLDCILFLLFHLELSTPSSISPLAAASSAAIFLKVFLRFYRMPEIQRTFKIHIGTQLKRKVFSSFDNGI